MSRPNPFAQSYFRTCTVGSDGLTLAATGTTFAVATNQFLLFNAGRLYTFSWRFFTGQVGADAAAIFIRLPFGITPLAALAVPTFVQSSATAGETALATVFAAGNNSQTSAHIQIVRANNTNWLLAETLNMMGQISFEMPVT